VNVAFGLARLGVPTTLLTALGDDEDGQLIAAHLATVGVALADGSVVPGAATSTAVAQLEEDGSASYTFDVRWNLPGDCRVPADAVAVHAGSIAAAVPPGAQRVLELFEQTDPAVLRTFDPNVRPVITPDRATVLANVERFARCADVFKLSEEDAAWLLPGRDVWSVADWALSRGVRLFAMTRGAAGCVLATAGHRVEQPGIRTHVVDTIGAGDAFMSALVTGTLRWGLTESLTSGTLTVGEIEALASLAQRIASATVAQVGAHPPTWAEVS
jgi:fructokinase